jgi:hypothetical protein
VSVLGAEFDWSDINDIIRISRTPGETL